MIVSSSVGELDLFMGPKFLRKYVVMTCYNPSIRMQTLKNLGQGPTVLELWTMPNFDRGSRSIQTFRGGHPDRAWLVV